MEVLILIIVLLLLVGFTIFKLQKSSYSKETLNILKNNFENSDFSKIGSSEELKEKLEINSNTKYSSSIKKILADSKHKIDILSNYRIKHRLPYNELSFLKVTANCVIDLSIRKELNLKESIKLLFLVLESPELEEIIGDEANSEFLLKNFSNLLEGFVVRYNKKFQELEL